MSLCANRRKWEIISIYYISYILYSFSEEIKCCLLFHPLQQMTFISRPLSASNNTVLWESFEWHDTLIIQREFAGGGNRKVWETVLILARLIPEPETAACDLHTRRNARWLHHEMVKHRVCVCLRIRACSYHFIMEMLINACRRSSIDHSRSCMQTKTHSHWQMHLKARRCMKNHQQRQKYKISPHLHTHTHTGWWW